MVILDILVHTCISDYGKYANYTYFIDMRHCGSINEIYRRNSRLGKYSKVRKYSYTKMSFVYIYYVKQAKSTLKAKRRGQSRVQDFSLICEYLRWSKKHALNSIEKQLNNPVLRIYSLVHPTSSPSSRMLKTLLLIIKYGTTTCASAVIDMVAGVPP